MPVPVYVSLYPCACVCVHVCVCGCVCRVHMCMCYHLEKMTRQGIRETRKHNIILTLLGITLGNMDTIEYKIITGNLLIN